MLSLALCFRVFCEVVQFVLVSPSLSNPVLLGRHRLLYLHGQKGFLPLTLASVFLSGLILVDQENTLLIC